MSRYALLSVNDGRAPWAALSPNGQVDSSVVHPAPGHGAARHQSLPNADAYSPPHLDVNCSRPLSWMFSRSCESPRFL